MEKQDYIAICGRQNELSLIELESILGTGHVSKFGKHAKIDSFPEINNLGGTIKIGKIIQSFDTNKLAAISVDPNLLPEQTGKTTFGISAYDFSLRPRDLEAFGLKLKKILKENGPARLVLPKPGTNELNVAAIKFNNLLDHGFELLLVTNGNQSVVALTQSYQDIDAYSQRDHSRPDRSAKVGMLPPKLAQILINTTSAKTIYDPFCGTGVILQEALLMGRDAYGSDIEERMVESTTTNLKWLAQSHSDLGVWSAKPADAVSANLPINEVAIVSEGYLGPNLTAPPTRQLLEEIMPPLIDLYIKTLKNFYNQLPENSEVSICAPAWWIENKWLTLPIIDEIADLGYTIKDFETVQHSPLVYGRTGQAVGRALILLRKV
jgi:DNA methylase